MILLTAKGSTADKAKGLDLGADDYVAKPFHLDELAARVRAVLRRASGVAPGVGVVRFDDIEIDLERRMVDRGGELVELSRTEWLLLQHLAANAGKVVLHTELLTKVWGPEYRDDLQYLRVWVSRVRRKLGARPGEPGRIKTFQGIGYLLDVERRSGGWPATGRTTGAACCRRHGAGGAGYGAPPPHLAAHKQAARGGGPGPLAYLEDAPSPASPIEVRRDHEADTSLVRPACTAAPPDNRRRRCIGVADVSSARLAPQSSIAYISPRR